MVKSIEKTTGYIWYNPDMGLYQKGSKAEFDNFFKLSGRKEEFTLILKLNAVSNILAYKMVKELNAAKESVSSPMRLAM